MLTQLCLTFCYIILQVLAEECFKPKCPSFGMVSTTMANLSPNTTIVQIVEGPIGSDVTLDCSGALSDCMIPGSQCLFNTVWHRYADCPTTNFQPGSRVNTSGQYGVRLNIASLSSQDTGIWTCSITATSSKRLMTDVDAYRLFYVHIDDSSVTNRINTLHTGMQCAGPNQLWNCQPGEVCYKHKTTLPGNQTDLTAGCWPIQDIPLTVLQSASLDPDRACTYVTGGFCKVGVIAAANSTCCYCFSDKCNYRDVNPQTHTWAQKNTYAPDSSACKSYNQITAGLFNARQSQTDKSRPGGHAHNSNKLNSLLVPFTVLIALYSLIKA